MQDAPSLLLLLAMRQHFLGEQFHRAPDRGMVYQSALIEVADELVHMEVALQGLDTLDAVIWIAEDSHVSVYAFVGHAVQATHHLLESFIAFDCRLFSGRKRSPAARKKFSKLASHS